MVVPLLGRLSFLLLVAAAATTTFATGIHRNSIIRKPSSDVPTFREAPKFRNGDFCSYNASERIHIAMTLDENYLRGTMAAVLSVLKHSTCPGNMEFHFLWGKYEPDVLQSINRIFPYLNFRVYRFDSDRVRGKISRSIRQALDQPLNYARIYLANILLPPNVKRVLYLDSDLVLVDDILKLWEVDLEGKVLAAPEYCHANFTQYFTDSFWLDKELTGAFKGRRPCYFNTGVMVVDVDQWRQGGYLSKVEDWMAMQKKRIYTLGSLPPFLLVLAGNIKAVHHRWNQHGLGGDNIEGKCRSLHPGPISLLHWSGKGKPWLRLDSRKPCPVDHLWAPFDLYGSPVHSLEEE